MSEERRSCSRVRAYRPVRLTLPRSQQVVETLTRDVGGGGMCCLSVAPFPISTAVNVELLLMEGGETFSLRGKAVWFRNIPYSDQFEIGVSFLDMTPYDLRRLSVSLEQISNKAPLVHA